MFDMAIATTAISSFNNAALYGPFFLGIGLLSMPLFVMVYIYGRDFVSKFGWNNHNIENQIVLWTGIITMLWLVLFGGNYAVIRDGISLLPILLALVLFCLTVAVTQQSVKLNYLSKIQNLKHKCLFVLMLILLVATSGIMNWWGILLQISALVCGAIVGCRLNKNVSLYAGLTPVLLLLLILVLMQPEYFRFGQLGNLTVFHLAAVFITGFFAVTALVAKYANACGKIHNSAYVKLKWLVRIFAILALILFWLTESVPVFIGLLIMTALCEFLTIYHSKHKNNAIARQSLALFLFCFGIVIVCPVLSALGIVYAVFNPSDARAKDYTELL